MTGSMVLAPLVQWFVIVVVLAGARPGRVDRGLTCAERVHMPFPRVAGLFVGASAGVVWAVFSRCVYDCAPLFQSVLPCVQKTQ
jgi:hypothetical protein